MQLSEPYPEHNRILAGRVFDSHSKEFLSDQLITVCPRRGIIIDIRTLSSEEQTLLLHSDGDDVIDLRQQTVLPGFVDAHVHCEHARLFSKSVRQYNLPIRIVFLHPYSETSWEDQVTRETIIERTVRAVTHAKKTLLAGFTTVRQVSIIKKALLSLNNITVRDLGTEGAGDADITLRKCLSGADALIPGPRYFCANRALVTTGSYG
jgi:cytosine/adenosine deaminase-related metal-dependent hydrolase